MSPGNSSSSPLPEPGALFPGGCWGRMYTMLRHAHSVSEGMQGTPFSGAEGAQGGREWGLTWTLHMSPSRGMPVRQAPLIALFSN